jgi:hypothetical protein
MVWGGYCDLKHKAAKIPALKTTGKATIFDRRMFLLTENLKFDRVTQYIFGAE